MAVQGPLARTVADVRAGLEAMAADDSRDALWVPAPLEAPPLPTPVRAAVCPDPFGDAKPEIKDAVTAAGTCLADAGYQVDEENLPRIREAADLWHRLVPNVDRFGLEEQLRRFGDERARRNYDAHFSYAPQLDAEGVLRALQYRISLIRAWQLFLDVYPIVILPVSHAPPFPIAVNQTTDTVMQHRMIDSQRSLVATAALGFPSVELPTGLTPHGPVGVQVLSRRFREDVCLRAAEAIEARVGSLTPVDPA
ncbi:MULTISPECIES: amidase family protein [Amycolatopsis]|uniref:Amidase family protein n=1 Tax=Amycolatopsis albidoflavus TaxID=102226 RepID=A0ABW5HT50_9PSEU